MLKTILSTSQDTRTSLEDLLLNLWSTPISPKMPSLGEILHNRTIQCPVRPSMPVNMEAVWNHPISKKLSQKYFNKSHNVKPLSQLNPGQEVLFLSPGDQKSYVPGTIVNKPQPHNATPSRPKAKRTAKLVSTYAPSNRISSPGKLHITHSQRRPLSWATSQSPVPTLEHNPNPKTEAPEHTLPSPIQMHSQVTTTAHFLAKPHTITPYPYTNSWLLPQSPHCLKWWQALQTHWSHWSIPHIPVHQ